MPGAEPERCHDLGETERSSPAHPGVGTGSGTTLTDVNESEFGKDGGGFTRLQDRHIAHGLGDLHRLRPYELPFELWSTVLEQHRDDLLEVLV